MKKYSIITLANGEKLVTNNCRETIIDAIITHQLPTIITVDTCIFNGYPLNPNELMFTETTIFISQILYIQNL